LRERFCEALRFDALAVELGCERTALARAFRARFRVSMGEYVRELRVAEVQRRLARGDDASLAEIALRCGFADQSHCTRVFRRLTGTTPAAWGRARRS
jgi:AraC-like DNA-binding protein